MINKILKNKNKKKKKKKKKDNYFNDLYLMIMNTFYF